MKVGDKVKIKTGKRGRPTFGEVIDILYPPDDADPNGSIAYRVVTKRGPEIYEANELEVINKENG